MSWLATEVPTCTASRLNSPPAAGSLGCLAPHSTPAHAAGLAHTRPRLSTSPFPSLVPAQTHTLSSLSLPQHRRSSMPIPLKPRFRRPSAVAATQPHGTCSPCISGSRSPQYIAPNILLLPRPRRQHNTRSPSQTPPASLSTHSAQSPLFDRQPRSVCMLHVSPAPACVAGTPAFLRPLFSKRIYNLPSSMPMPNVALPSPHPPMKHLPLCLPAGGWCHAEAPRRTPRPSAPLLCLPHCLFPPLFSHATLHRCVTWRDC